MAPRMTFEILRPDWPRLGNRLIGNRQIWAKVAYRVYSMLMCLPDRLSGEFECWAWGAERRRVGLRFSVFIIEKNYVIG